MARKGKITDIRLTEVYAQAQHDEGFKAWLKSKEAAFAIDEGFERAPALPDLTFDQEGLHSAEQIALELWSDRQQPFANREELRLSQNFAYFIGETFARSFEGTWVNIPAHPDIPGSKPAGGMVDLPFREMVIDPNVLLVVALDIRSGEHWSRIFGFAHSDYDAWVAAGRPERVLT